MVQSGYDEILDLGSGNAGDACTLAARLLDAAETALQARPHARRLALIAGGETTVKVAPGGGRGGRNQVVERRSRPNLLFFPSQLSSFIFRSTAHVLVGSD